jgi:protein tyrosine/serine phosphatase
MLALTSMAVSLTQTKTSSSNIVENFGKVNENYYRGSQPDAEGFAKLKKLGIKTVIDLRKDSEAGEPEWVRAAGMQYFNIPLKASHPATAEQTDYFLKLVNDPNNWPVYVHCKGGRHRTGALTAIYRITHDGWTADQAYKEMKEYDFEHGFFGGPTAQKNYVYSFYEQRHTGAGK